MIMNINKKAKIKKYADVDYKGYDIILKTEMDVEQLYDDAELHGSYLAQAYINRKNYEYDASKTYYYGEVKTSETTTNGVIVNEDEIEDIHDIIS